MNVDGAASVIDVRIPAFFTEFTSRQDGAISSGKLPQDIELGQGQLEFVVIDRRVVGTPIEEQSGPGDNAGE